MTYLGTGVPFTAWWDVRVGYVSTFLKTNLRSANKCSIIVTINYVKGRVILWNITAQSSGILVFMEHCSMNLGIIGISLFLRVSMSYRKNLF